MTSSCAVQREGEVPVSHCRHYRCLPAISSRDDYAAEAYSHGHTLSLATSRAERNRATGYPTFLANGYPLKVFHAFAIYSLAPIRRPVPRENRSCLKITQEPIRMDCGIEFSSLHCGKREGCTIGTPDSQVTQQKQPCLRSIWLAWGTTTTSRMLSMRSQA